MDGQKAPYFRIRSKQQSVKDHYLIYVNEDKYYLQTDDYNSVLYNFEEGATVDTSAAGTHLNLADGHLDAYNFKLSSKNVFINSANDADHYSTSPYFVIRDIQKNNQGQEIGINLFYVGADQYYLKSNNFRPMSDTDLGIGIKINLKEYGDLPSGIEAYNFNLRAGETAGKDHEIIITDNGEGQNPYFAVNTSVNNNTKTLVWIAKDAQYLESSDYAAPVAATESTEAIPGKGIRLSLSGKELKAYSGFQLKAYADNNKYIEINADPNTAYPLRVTDNFLVSWDGTVNATGGTFTNINAVGGTFSGNISVEGTFSGGTIVGASIYAANLYAGGSGQIGGSYIFQATPSGVTINGASISGGGSGGTSYGLSTGGHMTAQSADMDDLTVNRIVVNTKADFLESCQVYVAGNIGINWNPVASLDLITNGNACIQGHLGIGAWPQDAYLLNVDGGNVRIAGDLGIGGAPADGYDLTVSGKAKINADLDVHGDITMYGDLISEGNNGNYISFNDGVWIYGSTTSLFGSLNQIGKDASSTTEIRGTLTIVSDEKVTIGGQTLKDYLAENSIVKTAKKVEHSLTMKVGNSNVVFDGSADKSVTILTEARVKEIIESYGYTTLGEVNRLGMVDYKSGTDLPNHKHTFYISGYY